MNYLQNKRLYLSGPIELAQDIHNWRMEPVKQLTSRFGLNIFDPFSDPKQQWADDLRLAKKEKRFDVVTHIAKSFVRKDLSMVDRADILIARLPYGVPTTGTVHEIINAVNAKKPVLLMCEEGLDKIPSWYFGFIPVEVMFDSWDKLYSYLEEVDSGLHKSNDRWAFVYGLV